MRYSKNIGIMLFAALIAFALLNEFLITPLAISDSDFTTYSIVILLMLPLFALFMLKENFLPEVTAKDIIAGILAFLLLFLLIFILRVRLSYLFVDMRVDMLLFPLLIASLAMLLFGIKNLNRFRAIMVYSIFASPALLLWLASANGGFVAANTLVIYEIVKLGFPHAVYSAPMTITANGYSVGIGQTCVGIGILIGIVMFLAPLAYLYDGKAPRKALWMASGFLLMLLLNFLRMLGIAVSWFFFGPSNTIIAIHLFAGILLFYIAIIAMVLLSGKYGLAFPAAKKRAKRPERSKQNRLYLVGIFLAIAVAIAYYLLLSDYTGAHILSPLSVYQHGTFNASRLNGFVAMVSNQSNFDITAIQDTAQNSVVIAASNATFSRTDPIAMLVTSSLINDLPYLLTNTTIVGEMTFFSNDSTTQSVYYLESYGRSFMLFNEIIPYTYPNGTTTSIGVYAVVPANGTSASIHCSNYYNAPYTSIINFANPVSHNSWAGARIVSAYCIIKKLVRQ